MPTELISIFVQVPLVAAFVWFALAMVNAQRQATKMDQDRLLEHEKQLQVETHGFIENQNLQWREILEIERERRREAMDQGLREVNTVSAAIAKLADAMALQSEAFVRHDQSAIERHANLMNEIRTSQKSK